MSAFIVEEKTIDVVVSYLAKEANLELTRREFKKLGYDVTTEIGAERLANAMYGLNVMAVEQRYDDIEGMITSGGFGFKFISWKSKIEVYKKLTCWLYQCLEGNIPEHPLYKALKEFSNTLAHDIVSDLPEYEAILWE